MYTMIVFVSKYSSVLLMMDSPLYEVQEVLRSILAPFVGFVQVRAECSAQRAYIIFRTLGLRHLCVTDSSNRFGFKNRFCDKHT